MLRYWSYEYFRVARVIKRLKWQDSAVTEQGLLDEWLIGPLWVISHYLGFSTHTQYDFETHSYNLHCISQEVFSYKGWFSYRVSYEFAEALLELE